MPICKQRLNYCFPVHKNYSKLDEQVETLSRNLDTQKKKEVEGRYKTIGTRLILKEIKLKQIVIL